jgi:UDP-N-acetylglucosamine acyltransferase
MSRVHPTAIVDRCAELDIEVEVGPYSVIGAGVKIGKGSKIHSHVAIQGRTTIGEGNVIFPFATVGSAPQDLKFKGEPSDLIIGDRNTIREYVSLNPGTTGGGMVTRVGDQNVLPHRARLQRGEP